MSGTGPANNRSVRMQLKTVTALCLAGLMSGALVAGSFAQSMMSGAPLEPDPAIASMSNDELVAARQAAMKEDGGILRSALRLEGADAVAAAGTLLKNFTNFPALFREGSITDKSEALPVIWEKWDVFTGLFAEAQASAAAALAAANAGDMAGYQAGIKGIQPLCGTCHQQFRE
jgi:cytochrome c556